MLACAIAVAIGIAAGQWQTKRATEKAAIEAKIIDREVAPPLDLNSAPVNIEEAEYRRVRVQGEFVRDWPVYLNNRPNRGVPGFYVLMPFKIADSNQYVLVMRGWVPRNIADYTKLPEIKTPVQSVELEGIVRRHAGRLLQLGTPEKLQPGAIVQNVEIKEFAEASGLALQPFVIEQLSALDDNLVREWPRPSSGIQKHQGYAFQWYALAAMAFIFFVVTGLRRGTS